VLIGPDSPFVNLPRNLNPKQALFIDGIRYAVQMAELAYERLCATLYALTTKPNRSDEDIGPASIAAFLDAWSFVDSVNRLRDLQHQMPGLKKRGGYTLFRKNTDGFEDLRNVVQHLNNQIPEFAELGLPVWGSLRWFTLLDLQKMTGRYSVLVSGRLQGGEYPVFNPAGKQMPRAISYITLSCKRLEVSLTEGMNAVSYMVSALAPSLRAVVKNQPLASADILIEVDMQFLDPASAADGSQG
jgi:hypothetical protein